MKNKIDDILAGYDDGDFSFEAIDLPDPPEIEDREPFIAAPPMSTEHLEDMIGQLNDRLDSMQSHLEGATPEYQRDMKSLEQLIMPLLVKLSKGDQEYIKWPNRQDQVKNQMQRILAITRKYLVEE